MKVKFEARLAFHKGLFEKSAFAGDKNAKEDYNVSFLFEPGSAAEKALLAAEQEAAKAKWPGKDKEGNILWEKVLAAAHSKAHQLVQPGERRNSAGFEGMKFVSARSATRPTVVDRDRSPLTLSDGRVYSGCWGIAHVEVWAQDNSFGKRVNAELTGFQFKKDGDSFGGGAGPAKVDDFEELTAEDGGEPDPFA